MSFFKQFLPASQKPPDCREPPPRQHVSTIRHVSVEERAPPITLSRVREALYDPDADADILDAWNRPWLSPRPSGFEYDIQSSTVEHVLQAARKYLEVEILAEQTNVDSTSEFKFEKVVRHPKGHALPQFSTAEELRNVSDTDDLTIPVKNLGMTIDREMMDRIHAGLGPRPPKIEDLVQKLRLEPKGDSGSAEFPYVAETYVDLWEVLQSWNRRVGKIPDLREERQELLDALEERCRLITAIEAKFNKEEEAGEQQNSRVIRALHAFRPELKGFKVQNVLALLVMLIATYRIAVPDLDEETKDAVIKTLYREIRLTIYIGEEHTAEKNRVKAKMELAKAQNDKTAVAELTKQKMKLSDQTWTKAGHKLLTAIRFARKGLYDKVLADLQSLAEQQTGQKWATSEIAKAPAGLLAQKCIDTEDEVSSMLKEYAMNIGDDLESAVWFVLEMSLLGRDCHQQVGRFAGLDVTNAMERDAAIRRRLEDAETAETMMDVVDKSHLVQDMARSVLGCMDKLDSSLGKALEATSARYRAYDSLLARVEEGDAHYAVVEAFAVKEHAGAAEAAEQEGGRTLPRDTPPANRLPG